MDFIMFGFVRGGVAQNHQRIKILERFQRFRPVHFLRLIQNQNGAIALDDVNRTAGLELIQLFIDTAGILAGGIEGFILGLALL